VVEVKKNLLLFAVLAFPAIAGAANQTFLFQGTLTAVSPTTLTNPYDGATATLSGIYNVNVGIYNGQGTGNTVLMTNSTDLLTLDSAGSGHLPNVQTVNDVQRIVTGNGDDFLDLASANFTLPAITIFGGTGRETIWANSGDTIINAGTGNTTIRGGPGNDIIYGGTGMDTIDGGSGTDTINSGGGDDTIGGGPGTDSLSGNGGHNIIDGGTGTDTYTTGSASPMSSYSITRSGPVSFTIAALDSSSVDQLSNVEFAQFSDQTLDLSTVPAPEPTSLSFIACGIAALSLRRRKSSNR
jgi:Ca2+-binding RTX toxin-like protein